MEAGLTSSFRSILDKPLNQLTEEDISQLTREDCRKFLKEKGMRRPSWNKSQAIQQVISLKALLEGGSNDPAAGALRKVLVSPAPQPQPLPRPRPRPPPLQNASLVRSSSEPVQLVNETSIRNEIVPCRRKDPSKSIPTVEIGCTAGDSENKNVSPSPRSSCETKELGGQMTIFYCGKVNVFDGVPPEKARAIMHLAASSIDLPQDNTYSGNGPLRPVVCNLRATDKHGLAVALNSQTIQTEKLAEHSYRFGEKGNTSLELDVDGQANRKVSLQRYLEKRKDREKFFKGRKNAGQTTSTAGIYFNHQLKRQSPNGHSSRSSTSSPPQPGFPHASTSENQPKMVNLCVDLNDERIQEC